MKKALIYLDVILDILAKRNDHEAAVTILDMCLNRKLKGYVNSQDIAALSMLSLKFRTVSNGN